MWRRWLSIVAGVDVCDLCVVVVLVGVFVASAFVVVVAAVDDDEIHASEDDPSR